jgi:hypothetical protein
MKKPKNWLLNVPKQLDKQVRDHIEKYDISLADFVRKSVGYLLNEESPEPNGKKAMWLIGVHPELDKTMRELAEANYPSMSALIRYAVITQLQKEE